LFVDSNLFNANIDLDGIKIVIINPIVARMLPNKYGGPGMNRFESWVKKTGFQRLF
jgi:hypothetical protein